MVDSFFSAWVGVFVFGAIPPGGGLAPCWAVDPADDRMTGAALERRYFVRGPCGEDDEISEAAGERLAFVCVSVERNVTANVIVRLAELHYESEFPVRFFGVQVG